MAECRGPRFLSIPNFFVSLCIDHFAQIFKDALPGKPLPDLTNFLIHDSSCLLVSTFCWPLIGILLLTFGQKPWVWIAVSLILGLITFQISTTVWGLYMPMISGTTGMSDSPAH